jgi:hypothetical protein
MPNWCDCDLEIYGPKDDVQAVLKLVHQPDPNHVEYSIVHDGRQWFSFEAVVPMPREEHETAARIVREQMAAAGVEEGTQEGRQWLFDNYGSKWRGPIDAKSPINGFNWLGYDWAIENWGTKWGADEPTLEVWQLPDDCVQADYQFRTAWSPPKPIVAALAKRFPDVRFTLDGYERGAAYHSSDVFMDGECVSSVTERYDGERGG